MITLSVYKAQDIGDQKVEDANIIIGGDPIPSFDNLFDADGVCRNQGEQLNAVLRDTLPGGTYDQLLIAMLTQKASHFVVPFGNNK
jgi:hypothetical protein